MRTYFVFNNLKVNPFVLQDQPLPGFEVLVWENEAWTLGTLLDIGVDAGFTPIGHTKVHGQLWLAKDIYQTKQLETLAGVESGLTKIIKIPVVIQNNILKEEIEALTFKLTNISDYHRIVNDGKWTIKRD